MDEKQVASVNTPDSDKQTPGAETWTRKAPSTMPDVLCQHANKKTAQDEKTSGSTSDASSSNSSFEEQDEKPKDKSCPELLNMTSSSLCNLLVYTSGESSNGEDESDDSDSYDCESDTPEVVVPKRQATISKKKPDILADALKSIGELSLEDLPPVPNMTALNLSVKQDECDEIGKISSIVDKLVMVESIPNKPAYDIDTLLFLDNGKQPLGYIFDVIGAVTCPMYAIRFNSIEEIAALNISKGLPVFSAPKSEHTQYVFVQQLLKAKGTDASWKDDLEVPQDFQDFSDDEAEIGERQINPTSRKRNSIERYKNFEKDMNVKNLIDTRLHKIRDNFEPLTKKHTPSNNYKRGYQFQPSYRPNFGFSQANTSTSCAFPPHFGMPTFMPSNMPMPPYGPQNVTSFVPIGPPGFVPGLPPPLPNMPPYTAMPRGVTYPAPEMVAPMYPNVSIPPPNMAQTKGPPMMYPPDMGLPRPPTQTPGFVATVPFYDPRVPMWPNFPNPPPAARQPFPNPGRSYFTKRQ